MFGSDRKQIGMKCLDNKLDDFLKILEKNERRNQKL